VLTGRAVLKADKILNDIPDAKLKSVETQKKIIPVYIPPVLSGTATIACIIGCHLVNKRLHAGFIAAYGVTSTTLKAYKSKMTAEENARIQQEIDKDIVIANLEQLLNDRPGEEYELWKDDYREKPFWATKSDILLGKDEINRAMNDNNNLSGYFGQIGLKDFYAHVVGEPEPQDDIFGWDIDYMLEEWEDCYIDICWSEGEIYTNPKTGEQISCNHIHWNYQPIEDYQHYVSIYGR
jgi:hypothetical protein